MKAMGQLSYIRTTQIPLLLLSFSIVNKFPNFSSLSTGLEIMVDFFKIQRLGQSLYSTKRHISSIS